MTGTRILAERARELLSADVDERIAHIKKAVFISYPRATALLAEMDELLTHPKSIRPPNLLIVGRSNNGKSQILKEFKDRHPADERPTGDTTYAPVIFVQAPPSPNDKLFLDRALRVFNIEPRRSATEGEKIDLFLEQLRACGTRIMLIDELHSILAGPTYKQLTMLNTFKYLSNESGVSIVAAGTAGARDALATEPELANRFDERPLPRWDPADPAYKKLLQRFEAVLPLREASLLGQTALANAIFDISEGTIGGIARAVRDSAIAALKSGGEAITLEIVEATKARNAAHRADGARL